MDRETMFYKRLETEYNELLDDVYNMDTDTKVESASYISALTEIYDYLVTDKPIREGAGLEHYIKMDKPLSTIISQYTENMPPIHDRVNHSIWQIAEEKIYDFGDEHRYSTELKWELRMNNERYKDDFPKSIDKETWKSILDAVDDSDYQFEEEDAQYLLQFREPLVVLTKEIGNTEELFYKQVERAVTTLRNMDIITGPYALAHDRMLEDTQQRHEAFWNIGMIIDRPDSQITREWLDFFDEVNSAMNEETGAVENPYEEFVNTLSELSRHYDKEIVQQLYDMGKEHWILENELKEAAKYLADGGDVGKISELAKYGYFDSPYEENDMSAEDFLEEQNEESSGMTMQ